MSTVAHDTDLETVAALGQQLRVDSIRASTQAGSGHPTSSMSAADLTAVLITRHLRFDWAHPERPINDRFVLSKGHASPLLYAAYKAVGAIDDAELISTYRQQGSRLQGHPTPQLPWVDVATGSLGQGMPIAVGIALAGARLDQLPYHVYALCGDSEMAEGSIYEALDKASFYGLGNLTVIVDVNRLGQRGPTELEWNLHAYRARVEAFGCSAIEVDGHDVFAIDDALTVARTSERPTVVLAKTVKGQGYSGTANREGRHGKPLTPVEAAAAITELGGMRDLRVTAPMPIESASGEREQFQLGQPHAALSLPSWEVGSSVATRDAFGAALDALGSARPDVVVLDGEVGDSTRTLEFAKAHPERFFEMFIAEQQLVASAIGVATRGYRAFAATFGAFFSRAYDFARMDGVSQVNVCLVGSHAGVEIGADGPSQMALEDIASMRAVHGSTVLSPADATTTAALVAEMADCPGLSYMRTVRGAYPVIYPDGEAFAIGGSKTPRGAAEDQVALIGTGVTVYSCLEAADMLAAQGISARVIDAYSIKPIDAATLREAARVTDGRLVVAEDHHPEGGLGSAVLEALADTGAVPVEHFTHLAVRNLPASATSAQQLDEAGISAQHVTEAARGLVRQ
ncbi:MAG TPA: transketolase [Conexibacter sp.]|jgi:transketolase